MWAGKIEVQQEVEENSPVSLGSRNDSLERSAGRAIAYIDKLARLGPPHRPYVSLDLHVGDVFCGVPV